MSSASPCSFAAFLLDALRFDLTERLSHMGRGPTAGWLWQVVRGSGRSLLMTWPLAAHADNRFQLIAHHPMADHRSDDWC